MKARQIRLVIRGWLAREIGKATLALVLSIISSFVAGGVAVYQWQSGRSQARINAAVEVSRIYLVDREIPNRYALFLDPRPELDERFLRARSYLDFLDYIARLANKGLVDNDYIAPRIKCDINFVVMDPRGFKLGKETVDYVKAGSIAGCPDVPESKSK